MKRSSSRTQGSHTNGTCHLMTMEFLLGRGTIGPVKRIDLLLSLSLPTLTKMSSRILDLKLFPRLLVLFTSSNGGVHLSKTKHYPLLRRSERGMPYPKQDAPKYASNTSVPRLISGKRLHNGNIAKTDHNDLLGRHAHPRVDPLRQTTPGKPI